MSAYVVISLALLIAAALIGLLIVCKQVRLSFCVIKNYFSLLYLVRHFHLLHFQRVMYNTM